MGYQHKCNGTKENGELCDYESNDKLSVEMCQKRHSCTSEGHKQTGLIYDIKVTHSRCSCGKETPNLPKLTDQQQQAFIAEVMKLAPLTNLIKKYYQK